MAQNRGDPLTKIQNLQAEIVAELVKLQRDQSTKQLANRVLIASVENKFFKISLFLCANGMWMVQFGACCYSLGGNPSIMALIEEYAYIEDVALQKMALAGKEMPKYYLAERRGGLEDSLVWAMRRALRELRKLSAPK